MTMKFPKEEGVSGNSFARTLVKNYKVVPVLDHFLKDEVQDFAFQYEPKLQDDGWHPSGHCLTPPSVLFDYAVEGHLLARDTNAEQQKIFAVGHFWHQLLQHASLSTGIATPEAVERRGIRGWGVEESHDVGWGSINYYPWHYATGSGDIAPCNTGDWEGVVDFKTMSSNQYRSSSIPNWAAGKYEAQINIYMDFFDCDSGIIVALNKDSPHSMKEFEFERNQPLIEAIYTKWEYVSTCIDQGTPPDPKDDKFWDLDTFLEGPVAQ
jgi:hypothetical protein